MSARRSIAAMSGVFAVVLLVLAALGYAGALRDPKIVRYTVNLADWPPGQPPLRIVQLSDVHFAWPDMPEARIAAIVARVNALDPDLIVLTGDYHGGKLWDRDIGTMDVAIRPLSRLRARYGVLAVRGNHDEPYWTPIVFAKTPITLLQDRWIAAGPIIVAGVDDLFSPRDPSTAPARAIAGAPAGRPLVLLAHEPDFFRWLPGRVDLMIAGHTHGGQIVLPLIGGFDLKPYYTRYPRGRFIEGRRRLVVSSGIGTSIFPLRIGVPPEVVEITLTGYSTGRKSGTDR